ncbi:hypothetical protein GCM10023196_071400 [Actinoallomurus vinaceus]|uniref:Uncharacterized protein n=2 Tax=Actinoallomurus vinaceus TaxID=1080074 RepID=A0ABP8UNX9_9ACTN
MPSPKDKATDDARDRARRVGNRLYSGSVRPAQDVGHLADDIEGVDVMRVTGTTTTQGDGVGVVIRVSGTASKDWLEPEEITVVRCFELRISPKTEWGDEPRDVDCPRGRPLTFKPWPKSVEIPYERLRKALPRVPRGGTVDERKVRGAVASLHLDPAIHTEVQAEEGVVGVSLRVKPYLDDALDCALAQVAPGRTSVWSPPKIQRMPGEGGCGVGNAIHPMPPPH